MLDPNTLKFQDAYDPIASAIEREWHSLLGQAANESKATGALEDVLGASLVSTCKLFIDLEQVTCNQSGRLPSGLERF